MRLFGRDFVLLWQGQLVSQLGNQAFLVATISWTLQATGSAALIGLLLMASSIPALVLGPFAGALADRRSRRGLIVASDLLRGVAHVGLGLVMLSFPGATMTIVALLLAVGVLSSVLGALLTPALAAAIPDLVPPERLAAANSLHFLSIQGAALVGQAAGGVAYAVAGAAVLILFDGITFLVSAGCASLARIPQPTSVAALPGLRAQATAYRRDVGEGFAWLWQRPGLRSLTLAFAAVNLLFAPVFVVLPVYVRDILGKGPEWYGFLLAAAGGGAMAGAALAPVVRRGPRDLASALFGIGACTVALGTASSALLAFSLLLAIGLLSAILNVWVMTTLQASTPAELRGRIVAVTIALAGAAMPVGLGLGSLIGGLGRAALGFCVSACGVGIAAVAAAYWRLTRLKRDLPYTS